MPEGPEVTLITQYLNHHLAEANLLNIVVESDKFKALTSFKQFPLSLSSVNSKGKFLWFEFGTTSKIYLLHTLGLTGEWSFEPSAYNRIKFEFVKSGKKIDLFYNDKLNYGTFVLTQKKQMLDKKLAKLAPDVLKTHMSDTDLGKLIKTYVSTIARKKNNNIVKVFMDDQSAIVSGIGNYLIAEILYDACISPLRDITSLTDKEILKLAHSIRKLVKNAYYNNTSDYVSIFASFLNEHKKGISSGEYPNYHSDITPRTFRFKVYKKEKDPNGHTVHKDHVIKGRTIYWVPERQI